MRSARDLSYFKYRTFTAAGTLEAAANLRRIDLKLGDGAAERVAVHAKFLGRFALVAPVMRKHFDEVALLEFAHGFVVGDAAVMHLGHKAVQFASHVKTLFLMRGLVPLLFLSNAPWPRASPIPAPNSAACPRPCGSAVQAPGGPQPKP